MATVPSTPYFQQSSPPHATSQYKTSARPADAGNLIVYDDFSTDTLGSTNENGFTWFSGTSYRTIDTVEQTLDLTQVGNVDLNDDATEGEQGFTLAQAEREIWIRFKMRFPANFEHRETPGSENNKFMVVWMDDYSQLGTGSTVSFEFWPGVDGSRLAYHYRDVPTATNTPHVQHFEIAGPADLGVFNDYVVRLKANTSVDSSDGIIQLWMKRPTDADFILRQEQLDAQLNIATSGLSDGFKNGYILGWANSGYDVDTTFSYKDFYIGTGAASVQFTVPGV